MVDDVCTRCMVNESAVTMMVAKWKDDDNLYHQEPFRNTTDPKAVQEWAHQMIQRGAEFVVNQWNDAVKAITTFNGDPICSPHLWWALTKKGQPR